MVDRNSTLTLPKSSIREKEGIVILPLKRWKEIEKEHMELYSALQTVIAGEMALRKKQTRTFRELLTSEFPRYAKNF